MNREHELLKQVTLADTKELLAEMYHSSRIKSLERKLSSLVTDVCNECLGAGSLQFCGGEICPECNGTGNPPAEVSVYQCLHCSAQSLESDLGLFTLCSPGRHGNHNFKLSTVYTKGNYETKQT